MNVGVAIVSPLRAFPTSLGFCKVFHTVGAGSGFFPINHCPASCHGGCCAFSQAHSTVKCNTRIFDVEEDLVRGFVSEDLSGAGVEFILDPLDIGI